MNRFTTAHFRPPKFSTLLLILVCGFWLLCGCTKKLTRLAPPKLNPPNKDFLVVRDYHTTWNALVRSLDGKKGQKIKTKNRSKGMMTLEPVPVALDDVCDCGMLGDHPVGGMGTRKTTIRLRERAPKETLLVISCDYSKIHHWKKVDGQTVRKEIVSCVSNGTYELELYGWVIGYMSP